MTTEQKIENLEQALDLVSEAQELVDEAMRGSSLESNYKAYGRYGFDQIFGNGNPYDGSVQKVLDRLEEDLDNFNTCPNQCQ